VLYDQLLLTRFLYFKDSLYEIFLTYKLTPSHVYIYGVKRRRGERGKGGERGNGGRRGSGGRRGKGRT